MTHQTRISHEDVAELCVAALSVGKGKKISFDCITSPILTAPNSSSSSSSSSSLPAATTGKTALGGGTNNDNNDDGDDNDRKRSGSLKFYNMPTRTKTLSARTSNEDNHTNVAILDEDPVQTTRRGVTTTTATMTPTPAVPISASTMMTATTSTTTTTETSTTTTTATTTTTSIPDNAVANSKPKRKSAEDALLDFLQLSITTNYDNDL